MLYESNIFTLNPHKERKKKKKSYSFLDGTFCFLVENVFWCDIKENKVSFYIKLVAGYGFRPLELDG